MMPGAASRTGGHGMPPKMRTITFVDRLTFDFKGNVAQVKKKEIVSFLVKLLKTNLTN
jgi:hypothetical protein